MKAGLTMMTREHDPVEDELVRQAASDALSAINDGNIGNPTRIWAKGGMCRVVCSTKRIESGMDVIRVTVSVECPDDEQEKRDGRDGRRQAVADDDGTGRTGG